MQWTELLKTEAEATYHATEKLMDLVEPGDLDWKPATGDNWMTTGQLLQHLTTACGMTFRGFATGDWGLPEGVDPTDLPEGEMLPPASKMPSAASVQEAKAALAQDRATAMATLAEVGEKRLANDPAPAPWDPREIPLGQRLLSMVDHLKQHKGQLFYYLKLQGKPVNTMHLWGM